MTCFMRVVLFVFLKVCLAEYDEYVDYLVNQVDKSRGEIAVDLLQVKAVEVNKNDEHSNHTESMPRALLSSRGSDELEPSPMTFASPGCHCKCGTFNKKHHCAWNFGGGKGCYAYDGGGCRKHASRGSCEGARNDVWKQAPCKWTHFRCSCSNGQAASRDACTSNGNKCRSCNSGYTLDGNDCILTPSPTQSPTPSPTPMTTTTTTVVSLDGLDEVEREIEINDEQEDVHECEPWCYNEKHINMAWTCAITEERNCKCNWYACSTCAECQA